MTQKIKVQDGKIAYSSSDPDTPLEFNVAGNLSVGDDPAGDGVITTLDNIDLKIEPGKDLQLKSGPSGFITLNNIQWPNGTIEPVVGMYLGVSSENALQYYPFVIGTSPSDVETSVTLNANPLFSSATPGQVVTGPNVIYYSTGTGGWRRISAIPV